MMYDEFLKITGLTEKDVTLSEYQFDIEPAYTFVYAWQDKKHFCDFYTTVGYQVVREISANIMQKIKLQKDIERLQEEKDTLIDEKYDLLEKLQDIKNIVG